LLQVLLGHPKRELHMHHSEMDIESAWPTDACYM
jgi:hypothetical protein